MPSRVLNTSSFMFGTLTVDIGFVERKPTRVRYRVGYYSMALVSVSSFRSI